VAMGEVDRWAGSSSARRQLPWKQNTCQ